MLCLLTRIEGLLKLAWFDEAEGEAVNIGNPNEVTILELAEIIRKITKSSSQVEFHPLPPDDPKRWCWMQTKRENF